MKDALTIVVFHVSRQQSQSLLHVGQDLHLKAGSDFLQHINEPGGSRTREQQLPAVVKQITLQPRRTVRVDRS
jgi:hypothetical protein